MDLLTVNKFIYFTPFNWSEWNKKKSKKNKKDILPVWCVASTFSLIKNQLHS